MPFNPVAKIILDQLNKAATRILGALAREKLVLASLRLSVPQ
jgi:hypothetical protein